MFRIQTNLSISQTGDNRTKKFVFDFFDSYEWTSTWEKMTDNGFIRIPKDIYFRDENGKLISFSKKFDSNKNILRGDKISLQTGYKYKDKTGSEVTEMNTIFTGFISQVGSGTPLELKVEDNMFVLKQTPLENKTFSKSNTLEDILQFIIDSVNSMHGTSLTFSTLSTTTSFGQQLLVHNETAAQLLNRIHSLFGFNSYFRNDELRCGVRVYDENDATTDKIFIMNGDRGNVCADEQNIVFQRKSDIVLSAVAHNTIEERSGQFTHDGKEKTKKKRLEVLVTFKNGERIDRVLTTGDREPENDEGERRTFFFPFANTTKELADLAFEKLSQYCYDGLKGDFKCWAIPYVKHGDWIQIFNPLFPEQNGRYKVKKVKQTGSTNDGLRQTIEIDFKA